MSVNAVNKQTGNLLPLAGIQTYQFATMPPANSDNLNKIIQYVGTTTSNYINGYFYKCVFNDPSYIWENIAVNDVSISGAVFKGSILFANLPTTGMENGDWYDIKNTFTTDNRFEEGSGIACAAGTDVIWVTTDNKWNILTPSGVYSFNGRTGAVSPAIHDYDASDIDYDNTTSGLTATDVQDAIDELESNKANKVSSPTNGNFVGMDSNGNLTNSGSKASDFLPSNTPIPDAVTANPQGTAIGTLTKLGIGSKIYNIEGGTIDGNTVTPTNDIQTWLACAGLHQSYTTLNEVLADSGVLSALMANTNAVDYLVRSTTWATDICANETAMNCIGVNDYCADILKSNSTWLNAICNSAYFEEVLNVKVPILSNNTNVLYSGYTTQYDRQPYYAFDNNDSTIWMVDNTSAPQYIGYTFANNVNVCKVKMLRATGAEIKATLQCSDDNSNWTNCGSVTYSDESSEHELISNNSSKKKYWRLYLEASSSNFAHRTVQFYGRGKSPVVDTKADISAIATEEAGTTASRPYAIGEHFYKNGKFCTCTRAIAQGATFTLGTNYVEGTVADNVYNDKYVLSRLSERKNDFENFTYTMGTNDTYYKIVQAVTDGNVKKIVFTVPDSGFYSICIQNFQTHNGLIRALLKVDNVNVESFYNYVGTEYTTLHYFNYYLKAGQVVELNFNVTDIQIGIQTGTNSFRILD